MFTGIVEEKGKVARFIRRQGALELSIDCSVVHDKAALGDSIAVNGVCLTVVKIEDQRLTFEAVPETLKRTNLDRLSEGAPVNLERALTADKPMGGHYVQGHVDSIAELIGIAPEGEAMNLTFRTDPHLMPYLVEKGYISLDGTSLTIVAIEHDEFSITLVPHTQEAVVIGKEEVGYVANLEVDIMAKYIERMLAPRLAQLEARLARLEA